MNILCLLVTRLNNRLQLYWQVLIKLLQEIIDFIDSAKLQLKIAFLRLKSKYISVPIPPEAHGKLNLHLGCGNIDHEKFINIDGYPFPNVDYVQSIDKLPQFEDDSVDLIYASHCLEHFSYFKTYSVLVEWCRVLKKGAVLRLSVPDFDKLVEIYLNYEHDPDVILPELMGGQNNQYNYHFTAFSRVNLSKVLLAAGFTEVRGWLPRTDDLTTFNDFSIYKKEVMGSYYEISLNIEAVK